MNRDPFSLSMNTVIAASPMLGHILENRAPIRDAQDVEWIRTLQEKTSTPLRDASQRTLFAVSPLDVLVTRNAGGPQFHVIELNGTGIGGLTNITAEAIAPILEGLEETAATVAEPAPLLLLGVSGKESDDKPRLNKLMHEKLLFAEALQRGLESRHGPGSILTMAQLLRDPKPLSQPGPTVVLGYMKEFLRTLKLSENGRLTLFDRPVAGALNDRFCLNVVDMFGGRVDPAGFLTINRSFLAGADKGIAYELLNDVLAKDKPANFPTKVNFEYVPSRNAMVETVLSWLKNGRRAVIKPRATGVGHGIEFFLDPDEPAEEIIARIDGSVAFTERCYAAMGGAFPYTVCEFLDTCTIREPGHPLHGHKYELRVVVYRDGDWLRAFPSIVKVASRKFDAATRDRLALINNVTAATEEAHAAAMEYVLPLASRKTMDLLDLGESEMTHLCATSTAYVRHVLDRLQDAPTRYLPGLPAGS